MIMTAHIAAMVARMTVVADDMMEAVATSMVTVAGLVAVAAMVAVMGMSAKRER